jgi:mannosyltransferase OCH1-like enzyme
MDFSTATAPNPEVGAAKAQTIPQILHQIWYQGENALPEKYRRYRKTWQEHHPEWHFVLWDATSLREHIAAKWPAFLSVYDAFPYDVQRMDSARYCLLDTVGGVYADVDIECLRGVDGLLSGRELILSEAYGYNNALMASTPDHRIWKTVFRHLLVGVTAELDDVPVQMRASKAMQIAISAGPRFFTMCVHDSDVLTAPTTLSCPCDYFEAIPLDPGDSRIPMAEPYGRHDMDMNWLSPTHRHLSRLTRLGFRVVRTLRGLWMR